jgi:hypothetical protein
MMNIFWKAWRKRPFSSRPSKSRLRSRRLELERLEDRVVPSANLVVGPNVDITQLKGNEAETTISINPTNPKNLFEDDTITTAGHYSTDGGVTWKASNMSALPSSLGDVQSTWDSFGNLFLTEFGANSTVILARSSDGGATFKDVRTVITDSVDQPSLAFGPSGVAGIPEAIWVDAADPTTNSIVAAGAPVMGLDNVGTFSAPIVLPGSNYGANAPGNFGSIAVGPNGQVMANYQNITTIDGPDTINANLDPNGLGSLSFGNAFTITGTNVGGHAPIPAQPNRTIDAESNLAWDRSGGPHNGRVYLVYVDRPDVSSTNTNIYVRYSDNNGATWSAPVAVDPIGGDKSELQPAIAVDQATGNVAVTWLDTRNSGAANNTTQVFGTASIDGGNTWVPAVRISAGTSDASAVDNGFDNGDYDLMDFSHNIFYRTWTDNSNSTGNNPDGTAGLDIYTARVVLQTINITLTSATEGTPLNNVPVATFTDVSGVPLASYTATINWGDGIVSTASGSNGTIVSGGAPGFFIVYGSHTYINAGNYTLTVSVNNGTGTIGPASGNVAVADAPLHGFAQALNTVAAGSVTNGLVAVFTDTDPTLRPASQYTANITWNEGYGLSFSGTGTITHLSGNTFAVHASSPFTFPYGGLFTIQVVVRDTIGGATVTINSALSVANNTAIPPLIPIDQADTGPVNAQYIRMEDALTNLLKAERLFMTAFSFGTKAEKEGALGNLVNALLAYEVAVLFYDRTLPGA